MIDGEIGVDKLTGTMKPRREMGIVEGGREKERGVRVRKTTCRTI